MIIIIFLSSFALGFGIFVDNPVIYLSGGVIFFSIMIYLDKKAKNERK